MEQTLEKAQAESKQVKNLKRASGMSMKKIYEEMLREQRSTHGYMDGGNDDHYDDDDVDCYCE